MEIRIKSEWLTYSVGLVIRTKKGQQYNIPINQKMVAIDEDDYQVFAVDKNNYERLVYASDREKTDTRGTSVPDAGMPVSSGTTTSVLSPTQGVQGQHSRAKQTEQLPTDEIQTRSGSKSIKQPDSKSEG